MTTKDYFNFVALEELQVIKKQKPYIETFIYLQEKAKELEEIKEHSANSDGALECLYREKNLFLKCGKNKHHFHIFKCAVSHFYVVQ